MSDVCEVAQARTTLNELNFDVSPAESVDQITALEELKAACAAAQARAVMNLNSTRRQEHRDLGIPASKVGAGIASEIGLAARVSPNRGSRILGFARSLVQEMPHTMAALESGLLSEWRATILVKETAYLAMEDRVAIDAELCAHPAALHGVGDKALEARAKALAYQRDPHAVVERAANAPKDRRVTSRPAPDCMASVNALLPVAQGVGVIAALRQAADFHKGTGDVRSRDQIMADVLFERVTGRVAADGPVIRVNLVMPDTALLGNTDEPAYIEDYGPIPAEVARQMVATAAAAETGVELRKLYAKPKSGALVAMESVSRLFPKALAALIRLRDLTCRTAYCDAPIRHIDHIAPHAHGGRTTEVNGQGLCEQCNHAKQAPGWRSDAKHSAGERHWVLTTTPTGHQHRSTAPSTYRKRNQPHHASPIEDRLIAGVGGRIDLLQTATAHAA